MIRQLILLERHFQFLTVPLQEFLVNVNKETFENKWEQIRAQSKMWWGLFSEDDLDKVAKAPIKRDKYAMMLRVKYGYTHERARDEINKRVTELEANPPSSELMRNSLDRQANAKVSKTRNRRTKNKSFSDDNIELPY
jgi:hypothetical protein